MLLIEMNYLDYQTELARERDVKRRAALGVGFGFLLTLWGVWEAFFSLDSVTLGDRAILWGGLALFLIGLIIPDLLWPLERAVHAVGQRVMKLVLSAILTIIYILVVIPTAYVYQRIDRPIPVDGSTWVTKVSMQSEPARYRGRRTLYPFRILLYFVGTRQYVLLPIVIVLILVGMFFVFLQTSVLAPYIYTLF